MPSEVMDAFYRLCFDKKMYELAVEQRKLSERYHDQMLEYVDLGMRSSSDLQEVARACNLIFTRRR